MTKEILSLTTLVITSVYAKQPNIVVIYTDDQPLRTMSNIDPYFSTPNIDMLATKGILFENNFVCTSVSCVSRASILTGQHSLRHGVNSFDTPLTTEQMQQTYPGLLRKVGYRTAFLGKFGIGHPRAADKELCLPADQFDLWYGFIQGVSYSQMVNGEKRYVTTVIEEKSIDFLKDTPKDQPFLLTLALPEPHGQVGPWNYRDPDLFANQASLAVTDTPGKWYAGNVEQFTSSIVTGAFECASVAGATFYDSFLGQITSDATLVTKAQDISINTSKDSIYLYDDFTIDGEKLTNENGSSGKGWDDNWTIQSGSSNDILTSNGYLHTIGNSIGLIRNLTHPILLGSSTFYTSFLMSKDASGYFRITGFDDEGRSRFGVHIAVDGKIGAQAGTTESAASFSTESLIENDKTYLVVAKYRYENTKGNMQIAVFENSGSLLEDEASVSWDFSATGGTTGLPIDYFRMAFSSSSVLLDEFKIGDTWKSVTENTNFSFPPAAPTKLNFQSISSGSLQLSWEDNALNEEEYIILKDGVEIGTTSKNVTTYNIGGLVSDTKYLFGVYAQNAGGNSDTAVVEIKYMHADTSNLPVTEVQFVEQAQTSDSKTWSYKVTSPGNYQIGMAWIWLAEYDKQADLSVSVGDKLIKNMIVKSAEAPYRFETRLENLAVDDIIKVSVTPKDGASYQLGYKIAYATPIFTGLPVFDVQEFGAVGDGLNNDYQAIHSACLSAKSAGGGIVRFDGSKTYRVIGEKDYVLFDLQHVANIKIEGNGAKIILHPYGNFANINFSDNIQIDGFTTTYDPLPYYQGTITKIDMDGLYLEMQVPERYVAPVTGSYYRKFGRSFWITGPDRMGEGDHLNIRETEQIGDDDHAIRVYFNNDLTSTDRTLNETADLQHSKDNNATYYIAPHVEFGHNPGYRRVQYCDVSYSSRIKMSNILTQSICHMGYLVAGNYGPVTFTNTDVLAPNREDDLHVCWRDMWHVWGNRFGMMNEDGDYDAGLNYDDLFSPHMKIPLVDQASGTTILLKSKPGEEAALYTDSSIWKVNDWVSFWNENQTVFYGMARITGVNEGSSGSYIYINTDRDLKIKAGAYAINEETINRDMVVRKCNTTPQGRIIACRLRTPILFKDCNFQNIHMYAYCGEPWRPRPRNIVFENCYINERSSLKFNDTWNAVLKNCTLNKAGIELNNCNEMIIDNFKWTNATGNAIVAKNNSHAYVFGDYTWNNDSAMVQNKCTKDENSTITFDKRVVYPLYSPPFLPRDITFLGNETTNILDLSEKGTLSLSNYPDGIRVSIPEAGGQLAVFDILGRKLILKPVYDDYYSISNEIMGNSDNVIFISYRVKNKFYVAKIITH